MIQRFAARREIRRLSERHERIPEELRAIAYPQIEERTAEKKRVRHRIELRAIQDAVARVKATGNPASIKLVAEALAVPYASVVYAIKKLGSLADHVGIEKHQRRKT